ncbi:MAG: double-strand break repair helicase AddA [Rickettsiales bacterium]|nr:double-strand break repair helicase AddA [Rickettsiales bacterium]
MRAEKNNITKTIDYESGVFSPAASVFVSANAGAGKTSLLVKRVLSLLLQGVLPSKILCLTFTNAAAAEMSARILRELGRWVMAEEAELQNALKELLGEMPDSSRMEFARSLFARVLEAPDGVPMQTIHGFSQSLLRRFPLEAGVSPHFSVMEARTEQEMMAEASIRLFNRAQTDDPQLQQSIKALAHRLSESSFQQLLKAIVSDKRRFNELFQGPDDIESLTRSIAQRLNIAVDMTLPRLMAQHFSYDAAHKQLLHRAAELLADGKKTDQELAQGLLQWLQAPVKDVLAYVPLWITNDYDKRKRLFTQHLKDQACIDALLAEQERVYRFKRDWLTLEVLENTGHMLQVAEALLAIYDSLKRAYARMDYDDLILHSSQLLKRAGIAPWILFKLDGGIDHVLVDEAQDTSPEQWAIIHAITHEFFSGLGRSEVDRSLFVVGDEKQSIYSFQGADVAALGRMQRYFMERIREAGMQAKHVSLLHSFRSTREVLSAVDQVFATAETRAGLSFDDTPISHIVTRLESPGLVEVWPLIQVEKGDPASPGAMLARHIAATIEEWIAQGTANAGDIMILVRRRNAFVDQLVRSLKRRNIPVAGIDRMVLGDNIAVRDLLALGQVMLLPDDDLTLAAVLKSPLCNLDEEGLYRLAHGREGSLWESLRQQSADNRIFAELYAWLSELRARVDFISPFEFYSDVLDRQEGRKRIIGRMGSEYQEPLDEFLMQALLFEHSHTPSLQGFLHWMCNSDSEIKRDMEQAKGQVRIMTVHGSKGLQAPIVILPDSTEPARQSDVILWHEEEGAAALPLWPSSTKHDDALCGAIRKSGKDLEMEEYRRLLYVALTRAEDRLYIAGATRKSDANPLSWYQWVRQGLESIATPFTSTIGEGLRLGTLPTSQPAKASVASAATTATTHGTDWNFLLSAPEAEPSPPQPLAPSRMPDDAPLSLSPLTQHQRFRRGTLIHRLLQQLPTLDQNARDAFLASLANQPEQRACADEVMAVIQHPDFAFLFSPSSKAEVPVAGTVMWGGKSVALSGQIDRLYVSDDVVWIIDYKSDQITTQNAAPIPKAYLRQLALYQQLLQAIYPEKRVRCGILWTSILRLDEAMQPALDEARASAYI